MELRPFFTRIPDQSLIASDPGQKSEHIRATRDAEGRYAFIYLPTSRPVSVKLSPISGDRVRAWWYDPRSGQAEEVGQYPTSGEQEFIPPPDGPDWVLVLDDADQGFEIPGKVADKCDACF
jgi:hypothetical protein